MERFDEQTRRDKAAIDQLTIFCAAAIDRRDYRAFAAGWKFASRIISPIWSTGAPLFAG